MAFVLADRVRETSTTTGTGTISLAGSPSDYQGFVDAIGDGNTCFYAIENTGNDEWEVGIGTVHDGTPDTLTRDTVLSSSNAGALVNFAAGTMDVYVVHPADRTLVQNDEGVANIGDGTNYASFLADGELRLFGTARIKEVVQVFLSDIRSPTVAGADVVYDNEFRLLAFNASATESGYFKIHFPHKYTPGTDMSLHIDFIVDTVDAVTQRAVR